MSEPARSAPRTAAAVAARHRSTQAALDRVHDTIARLRREKTPVSVAAVACPERSSTPMRTRKPLSARRSARQPRVRQLTADNSTLDERLKAARSNLRFQDRRIADLEARLTEPANPTASTFR